MMEPDDRRAVDVSLCVFPRTGQTVIVDSRPSLAGRPRVVTVAASEIFSEGFYAGVEAAFREALRDDDRPILNLLSLPQKVEEMLREQAVRAILEAIEGDGAAGGGESGPVGGGAPSIAVLFFGGPLINVDAEHLRIAVTGLLERQLDGAALAEAVEQVIELALREQAAAGISPRANLEGLIRGDASGYATLWEASGDAGGA